MRPPLAIGTYGEIHMKKLETGKWEARAYFRDLTGRRREKRARGRTKSGAQTILKERLGDMSGVQEISPLTKFRELGDLWFENLQVRSSTKITYQRYLNFIYYHLGEYRLCEITTQTIDRFIRESSQKKTVDGRVRGGICIARQYLKLLRQIFSEGIRLGAIHQNPASSIYIKNTPRKPVKTLSVDEIRDIRRLIKESFQYSGRTPAQFFPPLIDFLIATGCRIGEALGSRWEDVDFSTGYLTIQGTMTRKGVYQTLTKTGENRSVKLPKWCLNMLRERKMLTPPGYKFIFWNSRGNMIHPSNVYKYWREIFNGPYGWVTPHTFRKTLATLVSRKYGSEVAAVQLGHESDVITKQSYIERKGKSDVSELLNNII